jgi:prophage DNA circulation protein
MNHLFKLGLAAAVVLSGASMANAEDTKVKAGSNMAAGATTDLTTTGSVNANYGQLISSLQAGKSADLAALNSGSTVECVKVSSLKAEGSNNAQALDNAITKNRTSLDTWQTGIKAKTDLMAKIKASCGLTTDVDVKDVLAIQSGTDGAFTVYFDDRA